LSGKKPKQWVDPKVSLMELTVNSKQIVLIRSTYSSSGGVERVTLSLIEGLLKKGIAVTLLTFPRQQWPVDHPRLQIVPLGIGRGHRLLQAWSFNRAVNRYLQRNKAHCALSLDKVTTHTHLHAGGGTHKSFLSIRDQYDNRWVRMARAFSLFHRYLLFLERKGFENPHFQKVRCNSHLVKEDIQRDYGVPDEKIVLIHSGIRWQAMGDAYEHRAELAQALCRRHHLNPQWPMILFLGSGFSRKGLDIAIRGLAAMPSSFHLVVVGKGAAYSYRRLALSQGLDGRLHFLGPQSQGWRYASFCKALVLPSQYDPFGGAAAEGHAMGVPVLVSDKTGYADRVIHGKNGVVLKTPMTAERIEGAFGQLAHLIAVPQWTPDQLRNHARDVDDEVILEQLLVSFLNV
jgi:UDP-glucose:(heptosyl)LPS alpha-1,3-glucosyltransferase